MKTKSDSDAGTYCCCSLIILAINLTIGVISVNYLVATWLHKTIPFLGALVVALFAAEVTIPAAIATWVLKASGVL